MEQTGPILKNVFINTTSNFTFEDGTSIGSTSSSSPYITKVGVEIKRRPPNYTNLEVKQLIFF